MFMIMKYDHDENLHKVLGFAPMSRPEACNELRKLVPQIKRAYPGAKFNFDGEEDIFVFSPPNQLIAEFRVVELVHLEDFS